MGYSDRLIKGKCANCNRTVVFKLKNDKVHYWDCKECSYINYFKRLTSWPELPHVLYIGYEKNRLLKIHPIPPDISANWAQPFSVRSFIYQASQALGGCHYSCFPYGSVMGEQVFTDLCSDFSFEDSRNTQKRECHLLSGWSKGQTYCELWKKIAALCQTNSERMFLYKYIELVKDCQFPMLIPQPRIGIAEKRRPDFIAFVPLSFWNYKRFAIQLDKAHTQYQSADDALRDKDLREHDYEIISLRSGYFEGVRSLVEQIDAQMNLVNSNPEKVAFEVQVIRLEEPVPF